MLALTCALSSIPRLAAAQADVWIEAGAVSARPPAGVVASSQTYGVLGARGRLESEDAGALDLYARAGRGGDGAAASWLEGAAAWELSRGTRHFAWGVRAGGFGLDYSQPFDYRALGGSFEPSLSLPLASAILALRGDLRHGSWTLGAGPLPADSAARGSLALDGAALTLGRLIGPVWIEAGGESYRGALDGWFTGGLAIVRWTAGRFDAGLNARAWSTPAGREAGIVGTALFTAADGIEFRAEIGRNTRDPLYGTPGSFGGSLAVSLRLAHAERGRQANAVAELGPGRADGRIARFRLHAPRAHAVALAGDFTDWRPRPMARDGDDWVLELTIGAGVHHFAFFVNGRDWMVPREAPGVTTDEWGRRNATLVVGL